MNATVNRILHILGLSVAVGVGIVTPLVTALPPGTTWAIRIGIAAGILSTLQKAFGSSETNANIQAVKDRGCAYITVQVLFLFSALGTVAGCAWWQAHFAQLNCAAIDVVEDAPTLVNIVATCSSIALTPAGILPCVEAVAGAKWPADVLQCFVAAEAMVRKGQPAKCPAFDKGKATLEAARVPR